MNGDQRIHPAGHLHTWWRSSFLGYPLAVVFATIAFLIPFSEKSLGIQDYFIEPPFVIATLLVGWIWGIGPAILALIIEILALDYWIVPPIGDLDFFLWPDIASFLPFVLIQLIVLGLVLVQKKYRQQLLLAHLELSQNAEKLAEKNHALSETNAQLDRANQALVQSNAQLDEANHIKDHFLSLASHELKTPITTIQGQAQLALRRLTRQPPLPVEFAFLPLHLEKVEAQTYRLYALVNDLLNLSSLRSGKIPLRIASCDFCSICRKVVEDQAALTDRLIDLTLPPDPILLQADEGRLSQIVTNLVTNAIKYSPARSTIETKITQSRTLVTLAVHNNGLAIPQERQKHLFEPFYRTPEAQASTIQGWGLGLAISKEIVEQHGGRIWVESSEEKGTAFCVELPISLDQEAT